MNQPRHVFGEVGVLTGHNDCVLQEVEEPQLRQVSRHDTDVGHGVWKFWERGEQGAGAELDFVRVVGAGPIQWVWPRPSERA